MKVVNIPILAFDPKDEWFDWQRNERMSLPENEAWFGPKKYGYGWGFPTRWQGWLVLALFVAALCAPAPFLGEPASTVAYLVYAVFLTLGVITICLWKGVKPRWRWRGDTDEDKKA